MSYGKFVNDLKELNIKKKGKKPKVSPQKFYPSQAELQAQELLKDELNNYSARLYRGALEGGVNGVYNVAGAVPEPFKESAQQVADMVAKFNVRAFASFSELVVGERYFPSSDEKNLILNTWTENFVNLCKSTNEEMRKKAAGIISDGVLGGRNLKELVKELQTTCRDFAKTKSELIACTEVGKLNSAIARNQSESAGIEYYEWSAAMDGRTRETHANMDGRICRWGKDDVYYEWVEGDNGKRELKEKKRTEKMYHGAPGTDFRCRCVALPYVPEFEDDYERPENQQGVVQKREDETKEEPKKDNQNSSSINEISKKFLDSMTSFGFVGSNDAENFKKELTSRINRLPEKVRKMWIEKASSIKIEKKSTKPPHCSPDGTSVHLCDNSINSIIHEVGHATAVEKSDKEFLKNLKARLSPLKSVSVDKCGNLKDRCIQINLGSVAYKEFIQGLNKNLKDVYSSREKRQIVEKIISSAGITPNETIVSRISDWLSLSGYEHFGFYHPKSYQKNFSNLLKYYELPHDQCVRGALSIELGAEIPEILSTEGGKKFLERFLPKTLKEYEDKVL